MFTILADAMYVATLAKRGTPIPNRYKDGRHNQEAERKRREAESYRYLW